MHNKILDEVPFGKDSLIGKLLRQPSPHFCELYRKMYELSINKDTLRQDKEDALKKMKAFKGLYIVNSIKPIWEYLTALVVKFGPDELVGELLNRARELSYICPVNKVYDTLKEMPINISHLLLSELNNMNAIIAFDNEKKESFEQTLCESKENVRDFLLICGFVSQMHPFNELQDDDLASVKQKCALLGVDYPYSDKVFSDDYVFDEEVLSESFAKDFVRKTLKNVILMQSIIPKEDLLEIDRILGSIIYRDEIVSLLNEVKDAIEAEFAKDNETGAGKYAILLSGWRNNYKNIAPEN